MAFLLDQRHVRLRSRLKGMYLHADKNGVSISLSSHHASLNMTWAVEAVHLRDLLGNYLSLQGIAYGRYLGLSLETQHDHFLWQAFRVGMPPTMKSSRAIAGTTHWHIEVTAVLPVPDLVLDSDFR